MGLISRLRSWLRAAPPVSIPNPWPGYDNCVGGVESIVIDGTRHYFGFDFKSDMVISPLIADTEVMAQFASRHMLQTDGKHDAGYWRELVADSEEDSELIGGDAADRTFTRAEMTAFRISLERAQGDDAAFPELRLSNHLLYLLSAASAWQLEDVDMADIESRIDIVAGRASLPEGSSVASEAEVAQLRLRDLVVAAPGNWSDLFRPLVAAG